MAPIVSRRQFIQSATASMVAVGFLGLRRVTEAGTGPADATGAGEAVGYGPLRADPRELLDLPAGFDYRILARGGARMSDGLRVPAMPDGMAAFAGENGRVVLVCNHEVDLNRPEQSAFGPKLELLDQVATDKLYDPGHGRAPGFGGTTNLVYNPETGEVERHFLSLAGTVRNCAGGAMPWGSWITCEETNHRAGEQLERDHGYCFEVPATSEPGLADPIPLKAMGRFYHEAVALDPKTGIVYMTEDLGDGLFYRFIPDKPGDLAAGGRLQALAIVDHRSMDTRNWTPLDGEPTEARIDAARTMPLNQPLAARWIDMEDVESPDDDLRHRGFAAGAARFARAEGIIQGADADGNTEIYLCCTNGGYRRKGQIFRYRPDAPPEGHDPAETTGRLDLFIEPNDGDLVENGDNLAVAPWGDLIVCEDNAGRDASPANRLVGVTPDGDLYTLASTTTGSELAGATFSPDGRTLFVNIQAEQLTLAITGPWREATG